MVTCIRCGRRWGSVAQLPIATVCDLCRVTRGIVGAISMALTLIVLGTMALAVLIALTEFGWIQF